ncbi:MAG: hypothetical protein ACNA8K_12315 [Cyclonatronaceae bacterium]
MSKEIESYKLRDIRVVVTETENPQRVNIHCSDGTYQHEFTARVYEYENYRRLMNQRIVERFDAAADRNK